MVVNLGTVGIVCKVFFHCFRETINREMPFSMGIKKDCKKKNL